MSIPTLQSCYKADLAGTFQYDMQNTAVIGLNTYNVLVNDGILTEQDDFGGPNPLNLQEVHFQVNGTPPITDLENGTLFILNLPGPTSGKQWEVVSTKFSADGNELIAQVRAA